MNINKDTKFAVIGLGVLGGSYVQALSNKGYTCIGLDIDQNTIDYALERKWIIDGGSDPSLVQDADIVISALYPHVFVEWIKTNQQYLKSGSILSDVTGVKRVVIDEINSILRDDIEYIAAHPMAGRESRGIYYADATIFAKANFIIVPTEKNTPYARQTIYELAQILGFAKITTLTADEHDKMIGFLSQLTHVMAVSLMNVNDNTHLVDYTGDSFRDLTRIAKINEDMWPELFILNKDNLVKEIDDLIKEIEEFKQLLIDENVQEMKQKMIQSTERRKKFDRT